MKSTKSFLSLFASATLLAGFSIGCGQKASDQQSSVKVTNGASITESEYPSVVLLVSLTPQGESICTGTFVNDSQVVTAAHCVEGLDAARPTIAYAKEDKATGEIGLAAVALNFVRQPAYDFAEGVNPKDIAVVNFPENTAPATSPLATTTPLVGDEMTIVGFGNNENFYDTTGSQSGSGAGNKRVGKNQVGKITDDGMIAFVGVPGAVPDLEAGELVGSGSGDSGGPLFVNGALAGVTSGGGLQESEIGLLSISFYVDVNNQVVKPFLDSVLKK